MCVKFHQLDRKKGAFFYFFAKTVRSSAASETVLVVEQKANEVKLLTFAVNSGAIAQVWVAFCCNMDPS